MDPYGPVPVEEVDEFGKPIPVIMETNVVETDYRLFRYSKFALPWLVFIFLCSVVLMMLSFWQGGFGNIKFMRPGVPRDLEPWTHSASGDGGVSRKIRNVRFATANIAIIPIFFVLIVYYANPRPKVQRVCYFSCAFFLCFSFVLGIIAFCLDVTRINDSRECHTNPTTLIMICESRAAYAAVCVALDLITAIFAIICAIMLFLFSKDDTFKHKHVSWTADQLEIAEEANYVEEVELKPVIPGQDIVHKALVFFGLTALMIAAILLDLFTIFIHEQRERVVGREWDPINNQIQTGWEQENTRFRLSVSILAILLCVLSFVPYPHRVLAYAIAWCFVIDGGMHFVIFAMDVNDLGTAKKMTCPSAVVCTFHEYNTTCVFDFFNGFLLLFYVIYEFLFKHQQSTVTVQRDLPTAPLEEFQPPSAFPQQEYAPIIKPDGTPAITAPALRPLLGVEVVEVQHPTTGQLHVTVINVTPGGAAQEAGLQIGDDIIRWNDIPISCKADFAQVVHSTPIGSQVALQVIRKAYGATSTASIQYLRLMVRGVPV